MLTSQVMIDTPRERSMTEEPFLTTKTTTRLAVTSHGCVEERNGRLLRLRDTSESLNTEMQWKYSN